MIDQSEPMIGARGVREAGAIRLPVRARLGRGLLLSAVFVCAACGLVYELVLVALGSYLIGDSVTQASIVLSVMVFAMGIGSLLAKRWRWRAATGFAVVEILLALVGGLSGFVLYGCFAWFGASRGALIAFAFGIGVLIGSEIPLLMALIQRFGRQEASGVVADLFAADYVGALVGGLAFPFLLLPLFGQLEAALLTGGVNVVSGGAVVLWLFRADLSRNARLALCAAAAAVLATLGACAVFASAFEAAARQAIYGTSVRIAEHTAIQEIVLTGRGADTLRLFIDGQLRVCGRDEHRYHESLVHPAMAGPRGTVLVLGGGDGLALREVLRYPDVRAVTLVEIDPGLVRLARGDPELSALNQHAHEDPRVRMVVADTFDWLRSHTDHGAYDVILADLPDPAITQSAKSYSQEFYTLAGRALDKRGRLVVHASSSVRRSQTYQTVRASIRAAGLRTTTYRVGGASSWFREDPDRVSGYGGRRSTEWRFVLASHGRKPALRLAGDVPPLRSLDGVSLRGAGLVAEADQGAPRPPSTLVRPRYLG